MESVRISNSFRVCFRPFRINAQQKGMDLFIGETDATVEQTDLSTFEQSTNLEKKK